MDIIRLFYNDIDIVPNVLLQHFFHYLGFYVQKVECDGNSKEMESVADIYVISDGFVKNQSIKDQSRVLDSMDRSKSILVLMDGWNCEDYAVKKIFFDAYKTQKEFLIAFVKLLSDIIAKDEGCQILCSDQNWKQAVIEVSEIYMDNRLLETSSITRCFYEQEEFFRWGIGQYSSFIERTSKEKSDFWRYVTLFAKYEANLISKKNLYIYRYDTKELLGECSELLRKYQKNEELHLLRADILFELEDNWMDGGDRYADTETRNSSYACLKIGKILRAYYKEYDKALNVLKKAVNINPKYYQAWYQLGDCYDLMGNYNESIKSFKKIYSILEYRYKKHMLAPLELEYLYKAVMRVAIVYKVRLGDYASAYAYNDIAKEIQREDAIDGYISQMISSAVNIEDMKSKIYETIKEHINIKLEDIY